MHKPTMLLTGFSIVMLGAALCVIGKMIVRNRPKAAKIVAYIGYALAATGAIITAISRR